MDGDVGHPDFRDKLTEISFFIIRYDSIHFEFKLLRKYDGLDDGSKIDSMNEYYE